MQKKAFSYFDPSLFLKLYLHSTDLLNIAMGPCRNLAGVSR